MGTAVLVWALWVTSGGYSNATYVTAYFTTKEECEFVQKLTNQQVHWSQCIKANYVLPLGKP